MRQRLAAAGAWLRCHPVEVVFALLCLAVLAYEFRITRQSYFYLDDWASARQSGSASLFLKPYNDSLLLVSLINYRVLLETFGFNYTPFRVVGLIGFVGVPFVYFVTTRRQFGAPVAGLLALPLLLWGKYVSLFPADINHNLALLCGIVCAAALNRGRRADWVLLVALTVAFGSAGEGAAIAAACLIHSACVRAPLRRYFVVLIPAFVRAIWWFIEIGHTNNRGPLVMTPTQMLSFSRDLAYAAFESAALGSTVFAVVLVVAFVTYAMWTATKGLKQAANLIAWSSAVVIWAVGLASSRGLFVQVTVFRYRYTTLVLFLLAVVSRRPLVWPRRLPIATDRRWALGAAGVVLILGGGRALAVHEDLARDAATSAKQGRATRAEALVIGLGESVTGNTPLGFDYGRLSFLFGGLSGAEVRALFAHYGQPFPATTATADRHLVELGGVGSRVVGTRDTTCGGMREPFAFRQTKGSSLLLWSANTPFDIDVRRFGEGWVRLRQARPGELVSVDLPWLPAVRPWQIRAVGACRANPPPP
jgi:hypothetical protein